MTSMAVLAFGRVWTELSLSGQCDGSKGAEYRRLLALWLQEGRPRPIREWIRRRAVGVPATDQTGPAAGEEVLP